VSAGHWFNDSREATSLAGPTTEKPRAEFQVEGELSPFEHERIFQILKKRFRVSEPSYLDLPDENLVTRVSITFYHPYDLSFFSEILTDGWRDLKGILKEIRHRRGGAGAAFNLIFTHEKTRLIFKTGLLDSEQNDSALDQVGHLTSIVAKTTQSLNLNVPIDRFECTFDGKTDRWNDFRAFPGSADRSFRFDDEKSVWTSFQWA